MRLSVTVPARYMQRPSLQNAWITGMDDCWTGRGSRVNLLGYEKAERQAYRAGYKAAEDARVV